MIENLSAVFKNCNTEVANAKIKFAEQMQSYYSWWFGINFVLVILLAIKSEKRKKYLSDNLLLFLLAINNFAQLLCGLLLLLV